MVARPAPSPQSRRILDLARADRRAATAALGQLPPEAQAAALCETPVAKRGELLNLLPRPEEVIPLVPEAELCFSIKAVGVTDSSWILELATPEQIVACVDLDAWSGDTPAIGTLGEWMATLAETEDEPLLLALRSLDPELLTLYLKARIHCVAKPDDSDGWDPPDGGQTLDGQFYLVPRTQDDIAHLVRLLQLLFVHDYWTYFRTVQGIIHELDTENEEWALRWRTGRLEDLGFPPWEDAMRIYGYLRPGEEATIPEDGDPLDVDAWHLPVWLPGFPAEVEDSPSIFSALAALGERERSGAFFAFVSLANRVAVADRMDLADAESTPRAIAKTARVASLGLEHIAREHGLDPVDTLRRVALERLFRVGANLDAAKASR